jgi:Rad3-related DNA helicase
MRRGLLAPPAWLGGGFDGSLALMLERPTLLCIDEAHCMFRKAAIHASRSYPV